MLACTPCGKKFTGVESYEQHLQSEKHKKKMSTIPKEESNPAYSENNPDSNCNKTIKCQVCDLSFDSFEHFQSHTMTQQHAEKVMQKSTIRNVIPSSEWAKNNQELSATECLVDSTDEESILPELNVNKSFGMSFQNCQPCGKMFSGSEPYKQHLESQAHKKKVALLQNPTNVGGNLTLSCEACNKHFSGEIPYEQHMRSEVHKKKLQNIQLLERYASGKSSNSEAGKNGIERKIDENKPWFCNTCNVQCSGAVPYAQHMSSEIHKKKLQNIQLLQSYASGKSSNSEAEKNGIERKVDENKLWFCNTCNLQCTGVVPYNQHIAGSIHLKNVKRAQISESLGMTNNGMTSVMQTCNLSDGKTSEKSENISQIVNGNYQTDNENRQNDFVLTEKFKFGIVSHDELGKLIKMITPDEKVSFDEIDTSKDSVNEKPDILQQNEHQSNEIFVKFKESNQNSFENGIKKIMEEEILLCD